MKKLLSKSNLLHVLIAIGLICTIELAIIYYQANYNIYAIPSFCSINDFVDCDGVAQTPTAVFLGVPLAYWGMFFYFFIFMLLHSDKIKKIKFLECFSAFKNIYSYISVLGVISFTISILLAIISIFQIKKICVLCIFTYFINLAIALVSTDFSKGGFASDIKTSVSDFIDGLKMYYIQFITFVLVAFLFLSYATVKMPFVSRKAAIQHYMSMKINPYKTTGNFLGNQKGTIVVRLYTDFGCPVCPSYNIMIHQLVKENPDIKVIHHQFPLDKECNKYLTTQMHEGGCRMARYSIAAENQGKYWDMSELLFETKPKNDKAAINLAKQLNLDIDKFSKDINSIETNKRLQNEIKTAISDGIDGTPTIVVNSRRFFGAKSYYEFKTLILRNNYD